MGIATAPSAAVAFFPLDQQLQLTKQSWSPETIQNAVQLGVEIASYEQAAKTFSALTGVALSKSALQRLVQTTGSAVVNAHAAEAQAMVEVPKAEAAVVWRETPKPDSAVMAVSSDGVMVNLIAEGWKEVKVVSISAVGSTVDAESGEVAVNLTHHSYRAGLWDAATFTNQHWAEACRRGIRASQNGGLY